MEVGFVISVVDGIIKIVGLENVFVSEIVSFFDSVHGIVLNIESICLVAIAVGSDDIQQGDLVERQYRELFVPIDFSFIGRTFDATGNFIDDFDDEK
jgi:F-type H+-transporting ATPase subunit alpha